jgi:hypothetical protein
VPSSLGYGFTGQGGSGGLPATNETVQPNNGYGGGDGGGNGVGAGTGAVRIIWAGTSGIIRAYPSTNTGNL